MTPPFAVFVIHSPRLTERRAPLEAALGALGWPAEWITTPDSAEFGLWARVRHRAHPRLTRSEMSVYLKHLDVLERIAHGTRDAAFILEDDAILPPHFDELVSRYLEALPPGSDAAFFGASSDLHADPLPSTPLFGAGLRTRSMSAVWITRASAIRLLERLEDRPLRHPIDIEIDDIIRGEPLACVWSVPPLVGNGSEGGRYPRAIIHAAWRQNPMIRRIQQWRLRWWRPRKPQRSPPR